MFLRAFGQPDHGGRRWGMHEKRPKQPRTSNHATPVLAVAMSTSLSIFRGSRRLLQPPILLADNDGMHEKMLTVVYTINLYVFC